jgi:hypothetical protein
MRRRWVQNNVILTNNTIADADAMDVTDNRVEGNLICFDNSPAVTWATPGAGGTR